MFTRSSTRILRRNLRSYLAIQNLPALKTPSVIPEKHDTVLSVFISIFEEYGCQMHTVQMTSWGVSLTLVRWQRACNKSCGKREARLQRHVSFLVCVRVIKF